MPKTFQYASTVRSRVLDHEGDLGHAVLQEGQRQGRGSVARGAGSIGRGVDPHVLVHQA